MKYIYSIALVAIVIGQCYSQDKIQFTTPEASTLIKYIDYPVSYDRGLVEISIPLFEINSAEISIPITLSYHHAGLKPQERSSWIGQGWSIRGLFSITKSINGYEDDCGRYIPADDAEQNREPFSFFFLNGIRDGNKEDPDEYHYNILGKSGSFMFRKNAVSGKFEPQTIPYEPIKINHEANNLFEITDDNGLLYLFKLYEYNHLQPNQGTKTWYIEKIISKSKKDTIYFDYYPPKQVVTYSVNHFVKVMDQSRYYVNTHFFPCGSLYCSPIISYPNITYTVGDMIRDTKRAFPYINFNEYSGFEEWTLQACESCTGASSLESGYQTTQYIKTNLKSIRYKHGQVGLANFYRTKS